MLNTNELQHYFDQVINKMRIVDTGISNNIVFAQGKANSLQGTYVFSDSEGYHLFETEKGNVLQDITTHDVDELIYSALSGIVFYTAMIYAKNNRKDGEDIRRQIFTHELDLWSAAGGKFLMLKKAEIEKTLAKAPYRD